LNKIKHKNYILSESEMKGEEDQPIISKSPVIEHRNSILDKNLSSNNQYRRFNTTSSIRLNRIRQTFENNKKIEEEPEYDISQNSSFRDLKPLSSFKDMKKFSFAYDPYDLRVFYLY
jgi:hypothetical protein